MGPTNVALVKLFRADQTLREAQGRLDATMKNVRIQERRVKDLTDRIKTAHGELMTKQAHSGNLDLDLKTRDAHIEKLRTQQNAVTTTKEYHAFATESKICKADRAKVEEEALALMEEIEKEGAALKEMQTQLEGEKTRLATMQTEIVDKTASIRKEIDALQPQRDAVAATVPQKAIEAFDRLAERFDGEALAAIAKPDRRAEEYSCTACNLDLVRDVYNRLHTRNEIVFCPSCRRILYIPEDLTPELAVHKPKERKSLAEKAPPAAAGRQSNAMDVLRSVEASTGGASGSHVEETSSEENASSEEPQQQAAEQPPAAQT